MTTVTKKKSFRIIAAVVSILVTACVLFIVMFTLNTQAVSKTKEPVLFKVEAGQYQAEVLKNLEAQGIIKSSFFAGLQARMDKTRNTFEGYFELDKSWSTKEILTYLSSDTNAAPMSVNVLLVEGSWAKDIAKKISQHTTADENTLLELWNDETYVRELMPYYEVLTEDIFKNKDVRILLEGFLYPDTYSFNVEASEKEITELLIANANRYYQQYKAKLETSDFSLYELLTLSSIVEYEASGDEDMRMVAGVFMNRLRDGIRLESSVTKCYALYEFDSWQDCERENPDSPYNTHRVSGLTPGPILNPSVRAIEATLDYAHHDYFFFIADVHGDGSVHYQKTYEEHEKVRMELLGY